MAVSINVPTTETYVRESLMNALDEVRQVHSSGGKLPDARHLFDNLDN